MIDDLLFTVIDNPTGHEYRIYASGKTEGFGEDISICNRFPALSRQRMVEYSYAQKKNEEQAKQTEQ